MATRGPQAPVAPVQVSSSLPSLARTRETVPPERFATQTSAPSQAQRYGLEPTVVRPTAPELCGVQNRSRAARRLPRLSRASTDRERNAAIWRRVTLAVGS